MYAPTSPIMSLSRLQPYISGGGIVHKRTDPIIGIFIFCPPTLKLTIYQPPSSTSLFSPMHIAPSSLLPPPLACFRLVSSCLLSPHSIYHCYILYRGCVEHASYYIIVFLYFCPLNLKYILSTSNAKSLSIGNLTGLVREVGFTKIKSLSVPNPNLTQARSPRQISPGQRYLRRKGWIYGE